MLKALAVTLKLCGKATVEDQDLTGCQTGSEGGGHFFLPSKTKIELTTLTKS